MLVATTNNAPRGDMNCEVFTLSPMRCEPFQVKEVLRAVLHTILFSRTLGVVRPRDVDSELFDLTYSTCGDAGVGPARGRRQRHPGWRRRKEKDAELRSAPLCSL